jgi:hypothetical protein
MATVQELNVKISADVNSAVNGLNATTEAAGKLAKVQPELVKNSNRANVALTNLGRVVSDAPFGLIGIANNIDPLLSSFQQLSRESGGAGGALKSLAASLRGPAGIAIAVTAATSVLIAFGDEIGNLLSGLTASERATASAG